MSANDAYQDMLRASEVFGAALERLLSHYPGQELLIDEGDWHNFRLCSPDILRKRRLAFGMDDQAAGFSVGNCLGVTDHYILGGFVEVDGQKRLVWNPQEAGHERGHCWQERLLGQPANQRMDHFMEGL